ncbi:MAG: amidohydrolase family protein [Deltaproteobacteria bacterium]|jgi:L-fuconolactonase|nr:amidohydrolase family protein [Deltaproteobacteria bacterium]
MTNGIVKSALRIDAHQHFWRYSKALYSWIDSSMEILKRDYLPVDLKPVLEKHQMNGSLAVQARASDEENSFLLELRKDHPFILGIVGWLDFCAPSLSAQLERLNSYSAIKGYRAMVQDMPSPSDFLESDAFNKGVKLLQDTSKVYELLIHEADLPAAVSFCRRHDRAPIVLCHLGKPDVKNGNPSFWEKILKNLASLSHVSVKISGIVTEAEWGKWTTSLLLPYLERTLQFFGPERILFGSDWPVCLLSAKTGEVYSLASKLAEILSTAEKELFWGKNAERIYCL